MAFPLVALLGVVSDVIGKIIPDPQKAAEAKLRMLELSQMGEFKEIEANLQVAVAQIEVNKIEAAQPGVFKGGWRPATGWLCVFGFGYTFIVRPILPWAMTVLGIPDVPPLPPIDTTELMVLLGGMLGLSGMRTFERTAGKA